MEIKLHYTDAEAKALFESFGLNVERDTILGRELAHGHRMPESEQLVVVNPTTRERIVLQNALTRLIKRKLIQDLFWSDNMDVLDALNCKGIEHPIKEMQEEVSITK